MEVNMLLSLCAIIISVLAGVAAPIISAFQTNSLRKRDNIKDASAAFWSAVSRFNPTNTVEQNISDTKELVRAGLVLKTYLPKTSDRALVDDCVLATINSSDDIATSEAKSAAIKKLIVCLNKRTK